MAATANGFNVEHIRQGPGTLWLIGVAPDDTDQRLTLAADLSPDSVEHANSKCFGLTQGGVTTTITSKAADIVVDQAEAPVDRYVQQVDMMIEATLSQQAVDLLQLAFTTGVYSTASGYKQITVGGVSIVPSFCVAVITPNRFGTGLATVSMLYKCSSEGGLTILNSREKNSAHKVQLKGMSDLTRTAGRQIGIHYETLAA